ncbi:MAG: ATPase [Candidatus Poribacteria bacterium]|nr:ATPase [Candidatus Poribacteria bacterium]
MGYIIGIDGGGTKTVGLLTTETGKHIAKVQVGPSNYHVVGTEQTHDVLKEIISQLSANFGSTALNSIRFCIGMAGLGREEDREVIGQICDKIGISKNRILTHDAHIALVGGIGKQEGVIIISGTGSIVYGIDSNGIEVRASGWGYLLGDEGSGYDIALKGLQAVARAADKREPPTELTHLILNKLDLDTPNDLIRWTHAASRDEIAGLAAVVFKAIEIGDTKAEKIVDSAFSELACAVETVVMQLELTHPFEIVFSGGNLLHQPILANKLQRWIEKIIIGSSVIFPKHEPAYGAVLLAKSHL